MAANTGGAQKTQGWPVVSAPGKLPVVNSIFDFSADALAQLRLWLEQNPPAIGISNILGFSQFTAQPATTIQVGTPETTTSAAFGDLATVGPQLTGLSDGKYLLLFGALGFGPAGSAGYMGVKINSTEATTAEALIFPNPSPMVPGAYALAKTLSGGGNNTVTTRYASGTGGSTAQFQARWLIALRYANK